MPSARPDQPIDEEWGVSASRLSGVLALEQHWTSPLNPGFSIAPALDLICDASGRVPPSRHRRFTTRDELGRLLDEWLVRGRRFCVLHVAGHGTPGVVCIGRGRECPERVTLDWLVQRLEGEAVGRWIHLGSCATLDLTARELKAIANRTGALGISGYATDVDHSPSAAWEILWFCQLAETAATRKGAQRAASWAKSASRSVFSTLHFRAVPSG